MIAKRLALLLVIASSLQAFAQDAVPPRPSPLSITSCKYKDTYLKIVYSQPQKKGREIFGKLVPFGEVWRTGANEATEITLTKDIFINNQLLAAGTYSLFSIPQRDKWTIIFNSDLGLWGSYNYNPAKDVLKFDVPVQSLPGELMFESFTISIDQKNNKADVILQWEKTKVSFSVDFIEPKP